MYIQDINIFILIFEKSILEIKKTKVDDLL